MTTTRERALHPKHASPHEYYESTVNQLRETAHRTLPTNADITNELTNNPDERCPF